MRHGRVISFLIDDSGYSQKDRHKVPHARRNMYIRASHFPGNGMSKNDCLGKSNLEKVHHSCDGWTLMHHSQGSRGASSH